MSPIIPQEYQPRSQGLDPLAPRWGKRSERIKTLGMRLQEYHLKLIIKTTNKIRENKLVRDIVTSIIYEIV